MVQLPQGSIKLNHVERINVHITTSGSTRPIWCTTNSRLFYIYIYIGSEQKSVDNTNDAYRVSNFELRVG